MSKNKDPRLEKIGASRYNQPVKTPGASKSHAVVAKEGDKVKLVRFGQQGVRGAGSSPKSAKDKARRRSFHARMDGIDSNPSKLSAMYWAKKVKW